MKTFSFIKLWFISTLLLSFSTVSYSDDIDLYITDRVATNNVNEASNANILFLMDTSGSMNLPIPVRFADAPFDPNFDYGESDDDNIYVYSIDDMTYLNRIVRADQNNCQDMKDTLNDPRLVAQPVYKGRTYQWQTEIAQTCDLLPQNGEIKGGRGDNTKTQLVAESVEIIDPSCTDEDSSNCNTITENLGTTYPLFVDKQGNETPQEIEPGKGFTMDLFATNNSGVFFEVRAFRAGGTDSVSVCSATVRASSNSNIGTQCAALSLPEGFDRIQLYATVTRNTTVFWSDFFVNTDIVSVFPGTDQEGCDPTQSVPRETPLWVGDIYQTTQDAATQSRHKVECQADGERSPAHGIIATDNLHPENCSNRNRCDSNTPARYGTRAIDSRVWEDINERFYVSANYHDYLQGSGSPDIAASSISDPDAFCRTQNFFRRFVNDGTIFTDNNGDIFICISRLSIMQSALSNVSRTLETEPVNLGLMQFNTINRRIFRQNQNSGGSIIQAVKNRSDSTPSFIERIENLSARGFTPLSESLYEAYRYFSGKSVQFGQLQTDINHGPNQITDSAALSGNNYKSPIINACQENFVVMLTDGEPTFDFEANDRIENLTGRSCRDSTSQTFDGACLDDIARYMANNDVNSDVEGVNRVRTFTIGLETDFELLEDTANAGGGRYFTANNSIELTDAFQQIALEILSEASTFVAPAVSVNAFNELNHRNELYYALFQPNRTPQWAGNIKKYRLSQQQIVDSNNALAIDESTGYFRSTAHSFWSATADGDTVTAGGATQQIPASRLLYSELDGSLSRLSLSSILNFTNTNLLGVDTVTEAQRVLQWMLGQDVTDRNANGSTTDAARFIADPLHNRPRVITFGGDANNPRDVLFYSTNLGTFHAIDPSDASGEELWTYWPKEHLDNPNVYLNNTNQSHHEYGLDGESSFVITEADGSSSRNFSVSNVKTFFGERRGGSRYYALDISNARINEDIDGQRDPSYSTPFKVLWKITGTNTEGSVRPNASAQTDTGFEDLAQTWSRPIPQTVKINGKATEVIVFTGGYDPIHDNPNESLNSLVGSETGNVTEYGNAIYVVDQLTGKLLFSAGNNNDSRNDTQHRIGVDMRHSIPASPTVFDVDGDGAFDIIFSIDIAGNVWRVDIDGTKSLTDSDFIRAGKIAQLSDTAEGRKFYNRLSVSRSSQPNGLSYYNIVAGSGYRANPLDPEPSVNRMYILYDDFRAKRDLETSEEDNRYRYYESGDEDNPSFRTVVPGDFVQSTFDQPAFRLTLRPDVGEDDPIRYINGLYIDFDFGEKMLQNATTTQNIILFSTFVPTPAAGTELACGNGSLGSSRVYALDLETGLSILRAGTEANPVVVPFLQTNRPGIPVNPTILITEDVSEASDDESTSDNGRVCDGDTCKERNQTVCFGTECNVGEGQFKFTAKLDPETKKDKIQKAIDDGNRGDCVDNPTISCIFRNPNTVYRTYWYDRTQ